MGRLAKTRRADRKRKVHLSPAEDPNLTVVHPDAAGIDIGARSIYVAVSPQRTDEHVQSFGTTTTELHRLAEWLDSVGIRQVAMESTGVYWIPLFEILQDRGITCCVVNAAHASNVPGRKSDVLDCQWLLQLHTFGLLRPSFRPEPIIVEFRTYMRQRASMAENAADWVRRMQKALTLMNLQLHTVISDITGKTGLSIINAILGGETDPKVLAELRDPRCRATVEEVEAALTGNYQPEHLFCLKQAHAMWMQAQSMIQECDDAAEALLQRVLENKLGADFVPPPPPKRGGKPSTMVPYTGLLASLAGVDLGKLPGFNNLTAARFIAEVGLDMSAWKNAKHFAAWLRLCPGSKITGGRKLSSRTLPTRSRATEVLRTAAVAAGRTKTALGAFHRRMKALHGPLAAVNATAHKLARIIYRLLTTGEEFQDPGVEAFEQERRERTRKHLEKKAARLGLALVELPEQAPPMEVVT